MGRGAGEAKEVVSGMCIFMSGFENTLWRMLDKTLNLKVIERTSKRVVTDNWTDICWDHFDLVIIRPKISEWFIECS